MTLPRNARLLAVWEQACGQPAVRRTWYLLRAIAEDKPGLDWENVTIGDADRQLLLLREELFGRRFDAVSKCPNCRENVEFSFNTSDFAVQSALPDSTETKTVVVEGCEIQFRLPRLSDLVEASESQDTGEAQSVLLQQCILKVSRVEDASVLPIQSLSSVMVDTVAREMEKVDPMTHTAMVLNCPACEKSWSNPFDLGSYLWHELDAWARGLLREVHQLARAYGWTEPEVLVLSARRRRLYLEMVSE